MAERKMPQNLEAEMSILGACFLSTYALDKVCEEVTKEVFYLDSHSKIFEVIQKLYEEKKPIDATTVTSEIINKVTIKKLEANVFELTKLIASKNFDKVMNIYHLYDYTPELKRAHSIKR